MCQINKTTIHNTKSDLRVLGGSILKVCTQIYSQSSPTLRYNWFNEKLLLGTLGLWTHFRIVDYSYKKLLIAQFCFYTQLVIYYVILVFNCHNGLFIEEVLFI